MSILYSEPMSRTATEGPRRHRYTVADYHLMGEVGILAPDARVELIDGEIIDMPPIGFQHSGIVDKLTRLLVMTCGERAIVRVQSSIRLGEHSEPQPDVALLRPRSDFYTTGHAAPSDVLLVLEIAATSLRYDRVRKLPLYARHGIAEVWLMDLKRAQVTRHRRPQTGQYVEIDRPALDAPLTVDALPGLTIDLRDLFAR
jgi:Uma2 family endonuclease